MKPPICCICDKSLDSPNDGGLIYFKKRVSDRQWEEKIEREGMVGHPPFAEWFCEKHYKKAFELKDLTIDKAMKQLQL